MSANESTHKEDVRNAYAMGVDAAQAAASWATDGNADVAERGRVLAMIREGDPQAWDYLPSRPNLSGEWADDPTPRSLAQEITGEDDPEPDTVDALADAFEAGVSEEFEPACERELMRFVGEDVSGHE